MGGNFALPVNGLWKMKQRNEEAVAELVVNWLQDSWEVYQEVQLFSGGPIADIVAKNGQILWVVEVKRTLSLAVLEQATHWLKLSHYVSVAHGAPKSTLGRMVARDYMRWKGIGEILVTGSYVIERVPPRLHRNVCSRHFNKRLCEQQKTFAKAGNSCGDRWTPYKETCRRLCAVVKEYPGISLKQAIDNIKHHYASTQSARSSLARWLWAGKIKGIVIKHDNGVLRLYEGVKNEATLSL